MMLTAKGGDAAGVAAGLLELADSDEVATLPPPARVDALYVSAEGSGNRTNGTVQVAERFLPTLERAVVAGTHFDFLKQSAGDIAAHVHSFFGDDA